MTLDPYPSARAPFRVGLAVATLFGLLLLAAACGSSDDGPDTPDAEDPAAPVPTSPAVKPPKAPPTPSGLGPGFAVTGPWASFYGTAAEMGDLAKAAATFRILNIDADPTADNFTTAQLEQLKAGGKNTVISYMNVGSCEQYREYWNEAPGFVPCGKNKAAQLGPYDGYPDEVWMDPSNEDYQKLIVEYVAPRLVARGIDGFYLDNMELISHGASDKDGPCSETCRKGGLELIRKLRAKFPDMRIIMQNGTSDVTRLGVTADGTEFRRLLDGIAHEEVYQPTFDKLAETELLAWQSMDMKSRAGTPFLILVEDYVGNCNNKKDAFDAIDKSLANGFSPYLSDESGEQRVVCYWGKP